MYGSVNYFENVARRQQNVGELQLNFIRVFLNPECDDITSPNFEPGSHLHFASNIKIILQKGCPYNSSMYLSS